MAPAEPLLELRAVMARLRAECPWKRSQTHQSLVRYLLEEAHETVEAVEGGDPGHLREELGDLLLQVYFHAVIAEEAGEFTIDDVAAGIAAKLRRRNPHVFGSPAAEAAGPPPGGSVPADPAAVNELWEAVKATEKGRRSPTDGIPATLPALLLADKVLDRRARAGLPVPEADPFPAAAGDDPAAVVGDRLLAAVARARALGVDPEQALRAAVRRLG